MREFSGGNFIFLVSQGVHSLPAGEIERITFMEETIASETEEDAAFVPVAEELPPPPAPSLEIITSASTFDRGVLLITGEVRNNTEERISFVRLLFTLHEVGGAVLARNCSYVEGPEPHLLPGETRSFRCAFIKPPGNTYKYKVSVESLSLAETNR